MGLSAQGTNLESKVIRPFLASGLQKRDLQKPILVCNIPNAATALLSPINCEHR